MAIIKTEVKIKPIINNELSRLSFIFMMVIVFLLSKDSEALFQSLLPKIID